ncbi:MAG: penicillin-binding protein 2, partial [Candidatus Moraniibacteriota bacterium]
LLLGRLFVLQVNQADKWKALAESQHTLSQSLRAERGEILLRDGDGMSPVAVNREYKLVYVVPKEIEDISRTALELSAVLSVDEQEIRGRLETRREDPFEVVKKRVSEEEMARLKELHLKGVYFLPEMYRYYPGAELASKVVGFVGPAEEGDVGVYGVESSFNNELHGKDGKLSQEKDAAGRWISLSDRDHVEAEDGQSVVLTIDRVVQYEVERILANALEKFGADQVSAIVMEPKTGKILAMAALPQFNPNEYGKEEDLSRFMNPTVSLPYEPGSIMKPITMAMGIEEGKVGPNTEFVDTGSVSEGGYTIRNAQDKVYGRSSMIKVLDESINTGAIFVERLIGNARFREYMERFGFGQRTGVRLPAENPGNLRNLFNPKATLQFYTAAFGQGVTVTPLQIVNAYSTIANGGVLMQPQIVDRYIKSDGTIVPVESHEVRRVVSEETARTLGTMLRSVVQNGHGKRADVPGYAVVGKTGTAQVAKQGSRGYEDSINIGSFAGYAPAKDPHYVVLVKVDNPKDVEWAESSAAPTFGAIMQFLLNYGKVQPT